MILQDYSGSFGNEFTYARDAVYAFVNLVGQVAIAGTSPGMGDKAGWMAFSDYVLDATNYPTGGWSTQTGYPYPAWSDSNITKNRPLALTRLDATSDLAVAKNKFYTSSTSKITYIGVGDNLDPRRNPATNLYYTKSTNTAAALNASLSYFKDGSGNWTNPGADHVVVIVSDGMPYYHNPGIPQGYKDNYGKWVPLKDGTWSKAQTTAAANTLGAAGIKLFVVTLCQDSGGTVYGFSGSDAEFNASLVRNGGYAFNTADPAKLADMMIGVASIEVGQASLIQ
jgi:hypothetical protein